MKTRRISTAAISTSMLFVALALPTSASIVETWESQANTNNPFNGSGDLTWTGDLAAWGVTTATWPPTPPSPDFAGDHSLRSSNHRSVAGAPVVETIITNISSEVDFAEAMEWSIFFSGQSASIQASRRADFILLSDTANVSTIEDPILMNGYKITLWDPFNAASGNLPPFSHEDNSLGDSLTLWRVDDTDERWREVGSISLTDPNINDGWNIRARLDIDGTWSIGFANGAIGQTPTLTSLGIDPGAPDFSAFTGSAYAGVGWTAPITDGDDTDFGFDNFSVSGTAPAVVPEPSTGLVLFGLILICWPAISSIRDVERD